MANTLQNTIDYIRPFCRYQAADIGVNSQPILGIASLVRNIVLAAPFIWDFNRNEFVSTNPSNSTQIGVQDYIFNIPEFGYLEQAALQDPQGKWWQIDEVLNNEGLAKASVKARPTIIAVQNSDGPILRFSAVPDQIYLINLVYQGVADQFTATTDDWSPIPDSFSDVYNNLTMGYYMDSCQDPRAPQYITRGIAGLIARASGLSEMDKAVFAASYMSYAQAQAVSALSTQQGVQAKGQR